MNAGFFMAFQASLVRNIQHNRFFPCFMGKVAIGTGRDGTRRLFPLLSFNDFRMNLFNPGVTFHACPGNILRRNGGFRIGVGQYHVTVVTIITSGRNNQALLKQTLAMDTQAVIFQDIMLGNFIHPGNGSAFPVTLPA